MSLLPEQAPMMSLCTRCYRVHRVPGPCEIDRRLVEQGEPETWKMLRERIRSVLSPVDGEQAEVSVPIEPKVVIAWVMSPADRKFLRALRIDPS